MNNQTGTPNPKNYQQLHARLTLKTVTIPATAEHDGYYAITVILKWNCPTCGEPRGEPHDARSYDGSRILYCHGWENPCGHIDKYDKLREEANSNEYN